MSSAYSSDAALLSLFLGDFSAHVGSHLFNCEWQTVQSQLSSQNSDHTGGSSTPNFPSTGILRAVNPAGSSSSSSGTVSSSSSACYIPRAVFVHQHGCIGSWHDVDGQLRGRDLQKALYTSARSSSAAGSSFVQSLLMPDGLGHAASVVEVVQDDDDVSSSSSSETEFGENNSRSFTDYLQLPLSSRNFSLLEGSFFGVNSIDAFPAGRCHLNSSSGDDSSKWKKCLVNTMENLRYFSEECDIVNGLQWMIDVDSAWSGFASSILESIRDDYGQKLPIFTVALTAPRKSYKKGINLAADSRRTLNESLAIHYLSEESSIYLPIDLYNFKSSNSSLFASSSNAETSNYTLASLVATLLHGQWTAHQIDEERCSMKKLSQLLAPLPAMKFLSLSALVPVDSHHPIWNVKDKEGHADGREKSKASNASSSSSSTSQSLQFSLHDSADLLRLSPLHSIPSESFELSSNKQQISLRDSDDESNDSDDVDSADLHNSLREDAKDIVISQAVIFRGVDRVAQTVKNAATILAAKAEMHKSTNRLWTQFAAPFIPPSSFPHSIQSVSPLCLMSELSNCRLTWRYLHSTAHKVKALKRSVSSMTASSLLTMTDAYGVVDQFVKDGVTKEELTEVTDAMMSLANDYRELK